MTELPLFYKNPVPLDSQKHRNHGLVRDFGFQFTEGVNAVPINLIEMPQICHFYPIAFSPDLNATPVAILGLTDQTNLFLTADNNWVKNVYIPAYIRRYPFIFSEIPEREELTLCVDMVPGIVAAEGENPFFEQDGSASELSNNALEFCKSYHAAAQQTLEFSKHLAELEILVDREAQFKTADDKVINFSGFRIVDEAKLAALSSEQVMELHKKGFLAFIYAHLFSGSQWQRLSYMYGQHISGGVADGLTAVFPQIQTDLFPSLDFYSAVRPQQR